MQGTKISMSVVQPVTSLTLLSLCLHVCVLTVQTINSPQQELYVIRYIPTSEQSDASQSGSFKGTTEVFFRLHNLSLSEAYWRAYI